MALCELYTSKEVEKATAQSIAEADVDVVGNELLILPICAVIVSLNPTALLLAAQLHNASQLSGWCLHFISSNFSVYESKEEFSLIAG